MLRAASLVFLTIAATGTALAADQIAVQRAKRHVNLPAGLPRPHYSYRTTITPSGSSLRRWRSRRAVYADGRSWRLHAESAGHTIAAGRTANPGLLWPGVSYDYQGPYYGGPDFSYFFACPTPAAFTAIAEAC